MEKNVVNNFGSFDVVFEKGNPNYKDVFEEFCEKGRKDRAYQTIRKQDSLWEIHLRKKFGKRFVDDISVADVEDYLSDLYYKKSIPIGMWKVS